MTRLALTLALICIPVTATIAAVEGGSEGISYGVPAALAVAMGLLGWVIRAALTRQLDALERLSRATLIIAQEMTKRPCLVESEKVKKLAEALLFSAGREDMP